MRLCVMLRAPVYLLSGGRGARGLVADGRVIRHIKVDLQQKLCKDMNRFQLALADELQWWSLRTR